MSGQTPLVEVSDLRKHFGGLSVINGLDLAVEPDEIVGILGPNGAGKSTLFNLIAGVLPASSGSIRYQGRDISNLRAWDRNRIGIARTYQIPKPFAHMSVFENLLVAAVNGRGMSIRQGRAEAEETLELIGLARVHNRPAGTLTLLDLKRLELARALASKPTLLLLDEIAGGLTDGECDLLLGVIRQVRSGRTIVWIEHVMNALRRACTRLALLHEGTILVAGEPEYVLADSRVKAVYLGTRRK